MGKKAHNIAQIQHNQFMSNKDNGNNPINYSILLIITDGIINDMKQTKDEIVAISNKKLPLSIIIVGVGNADFSKMDELDGDDGRLMNSKGQYAERDIVQFVPMNKYQRLSELSKETLVEIPDQFLSYVRAWGISPTEKQQNVQMNDFAISEEELKQDTFVIEKLPTLMPQVTQSNLLNWDSAPLPLRWERAYDENGNAYYVDHNTGKTQWEHPDK